MAWFKVDDALLMSSKVLSVPREIRNEAMGLWLQTAVWSAHEMKDGLIPFHVLMEYNANEAIVEALINANLWVRAEKNAVLIHNWNKYQPTRDELELRRNGVSAARAEAGKRSGESRRTKAEQNRTKLNPEPEPEPEPKKLGRATRLTNFEISQSMMDWAATHCPGLDVKASSERFIDYWVAQPGQKGVKLDWVATWRNWLRKDYESKPVSQKPTPTRTASDASQYCVHGWPLGECERGC